MFFKRNKGKKYCKIISNLDEYTIYGILFTANDNEITAKIEYSIPKIPLFKKKSIYIHDFMKNKGSSINSKISALNEAFMFKNSCSYKFVNSLPYYGLYLHVKELMIKENLINEDIIKKVEEERNERKRY